MSPLEEYSNLLTDKAATELKLKQIEKQIADISPAVMEWFERNGVSSAKVDSGHTLYLRRELWAGKMTGVDDEKAIAALQAEGLGDFCQPRINHQRLSAWTRELDREGKPLPEGLRDVIKVTEQFKVGHRSSADGKAKGEGSGE